MRCYYRAFDEDGIEIIQDWPEGEERGKCSMGWTGPEWVEEEASTESAAVKAEEVDEDVSEVTKIGWDDLIVDGADGLDGCNSPLSTTYTRLSSPSTAATSPAASPSVEPDECMAWPTPLPDPPRQLAQALPWPAPPTLSAAAHSFHLNIPSTSTSYWSSPPLDSAAFQSSSLFVPSPSPVPIFTPITSPAPTYAYHLDPTTTLPSPATTPSTLPASLPYPFRVSFSPHDHTTTLCPAPPPSPSHRRRTKARKLAPAPAAPVAGSASGGFWAGGPLSRSELLGWEGLGRLRGV